MLEKTPGNGWGQRAVGPRSIGSIGGSMAAKFTYERGDTGAHKMLIDSVRMKPSTYLVVVVAVVFTCGAAQEEKNLLKAIWKVNHPLIRHTTRLSTVTATVVQTVVIGGGACAKLVNVTGPCHLRRRSSQNEDDRDEEPVVLTFDDSDQQDDGSLVQLFTTTPTPVVR